MTEIHKFIFEMAKTFNMQGAYIRQHRSDNQEIYMTQLRDDIIAQGAVVHGRFPEFDMSVWYTAAGYMGVHPKHS